MAYITPPIPPTPTEASTWETWDRYLRAVAENNRVAQIEAQAAVDAARLANQANHAAAQQATAAAMARNADAQEKILAAMAETPGPARPTRADLVRQWVPHFNRAPGMGAVELATAAVESYAQAYPGAVLPDAESRPAKDV